MIAHANQPAALSPLSEAYREFDRDLRVLRAKAGYVLALVLMPAGVTLDYFVYPQLLWKIMQVRLLCDVGLLACFLFAFTKHAHRFSKLLDKPCVLLPTMSICWMIYMSEGALSPYYAGLNLMVIGGCLLIPYRTRESALVCASIMALYASACGMFRLAPPHSVIHQSQSLSLALAGQFLYNNVYFLALTSIICVTASYYMGRRRFQDFRLRHELDSNNRELATTIHKLKETEVQLVQSEKMNALGKLSAGLLHEVNNPLNYTFMALEAAQQDAVDNAAMKETLDDIHQGMSRIRSVIADLRSFAYPTKIVGGEPFQLDDALTTALRLTAHEIINVNVERKDVDVTARGSKTQIVHVFMNLLVNSAHAMSDKSLGRKPNILISTSRKDGKLIVSVKDNGTGVKKADLPRLFEPFFTTKRIGEGTGLGLSICQTIVSNHGGEMAVNSEEGQWTEVTFELTAAEEEDNAKRNSASTAAAASAAA
jgi:two-component system sensor histidine kinase PhcS